MMVKLQQINNFFVRCEIEQAEKSLKVSQVRQRWPDQNHLSAGIHNWDLLAQATAGGWVLQLPNEGN